METHVLTFNVTTSFEEWVTTFDASVPMQQAAGITAVFRGVSNEDHTKLCAVLQAGPGVLDKFMAENAELIAASGHVLESTVDQVFLSAP